MADLQMLATELDAEVSAVRQRLDDAEEHILRLRGRITRLGGGRHEPGEPDEPEAKAEGSYEERMLRGTR